MLSRIVGTSSVFLSYNRSVAAVFPQEGWRTTAKPHNNIALIFARIWDFKLFCSSCALIYEYSQIDNTVLKLRTCFKAAVSEVPQSMRFGQIPFAFTCRSAFFRNSEKSQTIPRACGRSLVHDLQLAFSSLWFVVGSALWKQAVITNRRKARVQV